MGTTAIGSSGASPGVTQGGDTAGTSPNPRVIALTDQALNRFPIGATLMEGQLLAIVSGEVRGVDPADAVPSGFIHVDGPLDTVAGAYEDMAGTSFTITLARPGKIAVSMAIAAESNGAGSAPTGEFAVSIGVEVADQDIGEIPRNFTGGGTDKGAIPIVAQTAGELAAGVHTIQPRFFRSAGTQTVRVTHINALALATA